MATDLSSTVNIRRVIPGTLLIVETAATADDTDYFTLTLADYGMAEFKAIQVCRHTTTDQVVVSGDDPTTAVSAGVLTVTIGGSTDNKRRVFLIWGQPTAS